MNKSISSKKWISYFYSETLKKITTKNIAYACILLGSILAVWFLLFGNFLTIDSLVPDVDKIKNIQPFISGIVVPAFTLGTTLLIVETFKNNIIQNVYNNVFKMIDQNRKILEGVNCASTNEDDIKSKGKDFFDDLAEIISQNFTVLAKQQLDPEKGFICI